MIQLCSRFTKARKLISSLWVGVFLSRFSNVVMENEELKYRTDKKYLLSCVAGAFIGGGIFGGVVGMVRNQPAPKYAVVAALQTAMFCSSFFIVREAHRHVYKVSSWKDDWILINTVSAGFSSGSFATVRFGGGGPSFAKGFVSGCLIGLAGSVAYSTLSYYHGIESESSKEKFKLDLPEWSPVKSLSEEEIQAKKKKIKTQHRMQDKED